jgi:hypothetical protein
LSLNSDHFPLLRAITQRDLERVEAAQSFADPQITQIVRSIQAGAPVHPGRLRVVYLPLPEYPPICVQEQRSAFELAIENRKFQSLVDCEMEFHRQVFQEVDQNLRRLNHLASATQAHNFKAQINQFIDNCDHISQLRSRNNKLRRTKERCLLRIARFLLLARVRCLEKAFALLDLSSFTAGVNTSTSSR